MSSLKFINNPSEIISNDTIYYLLDSRKFNTSLIRKIDTVVLSKNLLFNIDRRKFKKISNKIIKYLMKNNIRLFGIRILPNVLSTYRVIQTDDFKKEKFKKIKIGLQNG